MLEFASGFHDQIHESVRAIKFETSLPNRTAVAAFMRQSELFRGILACVRADVPSSAYPLVRTLLDAVVILKGVVADKEFPKELHNKSAKEKMSRVIRLAQDYEKFDSELPKDRLEEIRLRTEEQMYQEAKCAENTRALYQRLGMTHYYHMIYAHASLWVHVDMVTFEDYMKADFEKSGQLEFGVTYFSDAVMVTEAAVILFLQGYLDIAELFSISQFEREAFIVSCRAFVDDLAKKYAGSKDATLEL